MKKATPIVVLVASAYLLIAARPDAPAQLTSPEQQINRLEHAWLAAEASGNLAELRSLIADDFIGSSTAPGVLTKNDIVPPDGYPFGRLPKSSLRDSAVRVSGDCAVFIGYVTFDNSNQPGGLRVMNVYQKGAHGWHMIAADLSSGIPGQ